MKRHTGVHAVIVAILLSLFLSGGGPALGQGKVAPRPNYPSGFAPGTRVTLLEDHPAVPELKRGMSGTIICCDAVDGSGAILVSWDAYSGGGDEEGGCVTAVVGLHVSGSSTWVDPAQVKLGLPFNKIGVVQRDVEGCSYLTTDDGSMYYLVGDMQLGGGRWLPQLTYSARVRGLLNRSPAEAGRTCQQRDGDIYHPIVSMDDWDNTLCADRWVCNFDYGDRVVLISESNPNGATNLPRGATGTLICSRYEPGQSMLVSWDLWTEGGDDEAYAICNERISGLYPKGSTWWVSVKDLAKVLDTRCGVVQPIGLCVGDECLDPQALGLFAWPADVYYLAGLNVAAPSGRFRATGLFTRYGQLLGGQVEAADTVIREDLTGMILNPVVIPCPEPSSCQPPYQSGDRVELLFDEPGGAPGLLTGAAGTVLCTNPDDPIAPIFVSWDRWSGGNNEDAACNPDTHVGWYPDHSGWWMACAELKRLVLPDLYDVPESFHGFLPGTLVAGKQGQMLRVNVTIGNRGGEKSAPFFTGIYVSPDPEITRDDYEIGWIAMQIDPGGEASVASSILFPTNIPAGTYYIGWLADAENTVQEENEDNNVAVIEGAKLTITEP
jgi:hypothetical protein